jgi:hypothetical protein
MISREAHEGEGLQQQDREMGEAGESRRATRGVGNRSGPRASDRRRSRMRPDTDCGSVCWKVVPGGIAAIASWSTTPELLEVREDESRAARPAFGPGVDDNASQPLDERLLKGRRFRLQTCVVSRRIQLKAQPKKKAA